MLEQAVAACAETGAKRERAMALLLLSCACFHRRKSKQAVEYLKGVHEIVEEFGYDQFLYAEARLMPEVVDDASGAAASLAVASAVCGASLAPPQATASTAGITTRRSTVLM